MIETKSPNPFWWRKSVAPELAQNYSLGMPLPGTKPGERGFDAMADIQDDVANLDSLYQTATSKSTRRLARLALQPLLLGAGMPPAEFDAKYPPEPEEPTTLEKTLVDMDKLKELAAMFTGRGTGEG
jgi:hypothetical protein